MSGSKSSNVEDSMPDVRMDKNKRSLVLGAIILAMFMVAINVTIVSTALPSIVGDLGGFSLFSWVFSIYLLIQAVMVPIYGKLADLFGRKPVFAFGIIVFALGSLLCGFAQSMEMLILFRFIQGFGAGAVQPIATTIVGDMYTLEERAKIQGFLSSVWGISAILGPLLGGFFVEYIDWSWAFWVNLPLGLLALGGVLLFFKENIEQKKHEIDYVGSALLLLSISSLMLILLQGGVAWPWFSWPVLVLALVFLSGMSLFVWQENRAKDPVMPLDIWKNKLITVANIASLTTGAIMIGVSTFLPTFVQGVLERSPTIAGLTLAAMSIGWPLAATIAGRLVLRIGFRYTALLGSLSLILGSVFFILLGPDKGPLWAATGSFFIGVGMGLTTTTFVVSIQDSVSWQRRGVATSSNMFMRTLGGTIGAALLGGILNSRMATYLREQGEGMEGLPSVDVDFTNVLLDPETREQFSADVLQLLQDGLTVSLQSVYTTVFILALFTLAIVYFLPNRSKERAGAK